MESKIREIVKKGHEVCSRGVPWDGMHNETVKRILDVVDEEIQKQAKMEE